MRGLIMEDDNLSILTCASGEINAKSVIRNESDSLYPQLSSASTNQPPPPPKKKRNLPGNPDPEAEVVALSPKTLLTKNRFICEICNKGFQRDQNLQLHRRGHNLPWKLKQRSNKEVKKKVYVCPEPTCVHHHPARALGDLTGIKKHFCRKHGEKKWKCDKCSKHYAVQSDCKAHSKICGSREYRCDCGTLFSRRDSFITHRAFCDALAHQSTAVASSAMAAMNPLLHNAGFHPLIPVKREEAQFFTMSSQVPSWLASQAPSMAEPGSSNNLNIQPLENGQCLIIQNPQRNPNPTPLFASCSGFESSSRPVENVLNSGFDSHSQIDQNNGVSGKTSSDQSPETHNPSSFFHQMMSFEEASFEEALNGILQNRTNEKDGKNDAGETRDFLGLRGQIFNNEMNMDSSSGFGMNQSNQPTFWRY